MADIDYPFPQSLPRSRNDYALSRTTDEVVVDEVRNEWDNHRKVGQFILGMKRTLTFVLLHCWHNGANNSMMRS